MTHKVRITHKELQSMPDYPGVTKAYIAKKALIPIEYIIIMSENWVTDEYMTAEYTVVDTRDSLSGPVA